VLVKLVAERIWLGRSDLTRLDIGYNIVFLGVDKGRNLWAIPFKRPGTQRGRGRSRKGRIASLICNQNPL